MKIGDKIIVDIIDNGVNGEGVAKFKNFTIFVSYTLFGEQVEVEVYKIKNNIAFANVIKTIKESKNRTTPKCLLFGNCGGCDYQHTNYENQLKLKTNAVKTTLSKMLKQDCGVENCIASPKQFGYRNKVEIPVNDGKVGFYKWNTNEIVETKSCSLCEDWLQKLIETFNIFIKKYNISTYNKETRKGNIKHIVARYLDNCLTLVIVTNEKVFPHKNELIELLKNDFPRFSVFQNINSKTSGAVMSEKFIHLFGDKVQTAEDFEIKYEISPYSFLQTNKDVQNLIYQNILDKIDTNSTVIDAFSGAGLLSAIISKKCKKVYGIEIVKEATKNANELSRQNNIKNLENINGDCGIELPKLVEMLKEMGTSNINIILDPPRKGVGKEVVEAILKCQPSKIIYLSCNPPTLARDLKMLTANYQIESIQPYDMFPQTKHIETLVNLRKN